MSWLRSCRPLRAAARTDDGGRSAFKFKIGGLQISNKRVNNVLIPLRAICGDAFEDGLLSRNPVDRIRNLPNRSELIALEWGDVDWNKLVLRVRRASVRKIIKQPKTLSGEREVKLFPPAIEALEDQKPRTLLSRGRVFLDTRC